MNLILTPNQIISNRIIGSLRVIVKGKLYWFEVDDPKEKLTKAEFEAVIDFAKSIADQSQLHAVNGKNREVWTFYYFQEDFVDRLQDEFELLDFYFYKYSEVA